MTYTEELYYRCAALEHTRLRLLTALKVMQATHGMHGPCRQHSCSDCKRAYEMTLKVIREVEGPR